MYQCMQLNKFVNLSCISVKWIIFITYQNVLRTDVMGNWEHLHKDV